MQTNEGELIALTDAQTGRSYRVVRVRGGRGLQVRLHAMGLVPGAPVALLTPTARGPVLVAVRDSRLALGKGMANRILVTPCVGTPGATPRPAGPGEATPPPLPPTPAALTMADLREGEQAELLRIRGPGPLRHRLLAMGLTRGARLRVERYAPLRDPIEICIKGYLLALRVQEARLIDVTRIDTEPCRPSP